MKANDNYPQHSSVRRTPSAGRWLLLALSLPLVITLFGCRPLPPEVNTTGLDPAIAKVIHEAIDGTKRMPMSAEAWGRLGSTLMHYEFHAETTAAFERAERLGSMDPRWPYLHGLALSETDLPAATMKFRRAASLAGPEFDSPILRLAQTQAELGSNSAAEVSFDAVLQRKPGHGLAQLGLARLRLTTGQAEAATNLLTKCLANPHTAHGAHLVMAAAQQALGNPRLAKQFSEHAATLPTDTPWPDPWWTEALQYRVGRKATLDDASSLMDQGKLQESLPLLERATKEYPTDAEVWYLTGWNLVQQQQPAEAERALREHLRLSPQSPKGHAQLAVALLMQKRHREAIETLKAGVTLKPTWREFHSNLGFAHVQLGQTGEAMTHYRSALALDPNHLPSYTALAELLLRQNNRAEAQRLIEQASVLFPGDQRLRLLRDRASQTP